MPFSQRVPGLCALFLIAAGLGCSNHSGGSGPNTYATTGTQGDYAQWTVSGSTLSGNWEVTDGTGAVSRTLTVTASCADADSTYGYVACKVTDSTCLNGTQTCAGTDAPTVGATFYAFEVPGVALFVQGTGGGHAQVQVGFALDTSCSGAAGDYTFLHIGNDQKDLFGVYRVSANMSSITHADFNMSDGGACNGLGDGICAQTPTIGYSTAAAGGIETVSSNGCSSGVRTLVLGGGQTVRVMQSQSGVFILDLPSGNGGIVAFRNTQAATLASFANRSFGGITFPDDASPKLIAATTGAVSGTHVPISTLTFSDGSSTGITSPVIKPVTDTSSAASSPGFADFTAALNPAAAYSSNALSATYGTPSSIPGLFKIDGTYGDQGRIMLVATAYKGKTLAFGAVYNFRQAENAYVNAGAFILLEK